MSVRVLGHEPSWLRPLSARAGHACEAIVVVNDLSTAVLHDLRRARALVARQPALAVALLTLIDPRQPADALLSVLSALPPGVDLPLQPGLAAALMGAHWPRARVRADPGATTFEYQD
jgi:hypothetical protein